MVRAGRGQQAEGVHFLIRPPVRPRARLSPLPAGRSWLPQGRTLAESDVSWRHRLVCGLVGVHLPVLVLLTAGLGLGDSAARLAPLPVLALLLVAIGPFERRVRSVAASLALLGCSATVQLFTGRAEAAFHVFVVVAVIALYQDWAVYALAVAFVALEGAAAVALGYGSLGGVATETVLVLAECAVLVLLWLANEQAREGAQQLQAALWEGQSSVRARLEETDRIRTDLIGTVSHEFRTPLTGIRGAALTLLKHGERLDPASRTRLLGAVLDQQERLSRLLENMLTASRATSADPSAVAEVDAVAAEVAMLAGARRTGGPPVSVVVDAGTTARIDRHALHQVLANLVDNAQQHGAPGSAPLVAGGRDRDGVWLAVSNEGGPLDTEDAGQLFEPFTQADAGPTRSQEGLGMGLYVVRRLVEVYGGWVSVRSEGGWVTVEVRLQPVDVPLPRAAGQTPAPTSRPIR